MWRIFPHDNLSCGEFLHLTICYMDKFLHMTIFLHRHRPWCPWQIWGMPEERWLNTSLFNCLRFGFALNNIFCKVVSTAPHQLYQLYQEKSRWSRSQSVGNRDSHWPRYKGTPPLKKNVFFRALPKLPPPPSPSFGQLVHLFRPSNINVYIVFFNSGRGLPPPHSGNARKKTFFFKGGVP